jgi:hypothetical protein
VITGIDSCRIVILHSVAVDVAVVVAGGALATAALSP